MIRRMGARALVVVLAALGPLSQDAGAQTTLSAARSKILTQTPMGSSLPSAATNRPFRLGLENEISSLTFHSAPEHAAVPGSCSASASSLCYDYRTGRAVYRPARNLMPEIAGMRRESLSLKRDKVTFHYSF